MAMFNLSRAMATGMLAAALGLAALLPGKAHASDDLVRVLVNVADVIYHGGQPYYRHGRYDRHDRVVVVRDRYQRPSYYRYVPRGYGNSYRAASQYRYGAYRTAPPHGRAHGYYRDGYRAYPSHGYERRYRDHDDWRDYRRYQSRDDWRDDRRHGHGKKKWRKHRDD